MIALGMLYLLVLEGIIYAIWFYNTRLDRQPREQVIEWLKHNKMWDINQKLHYTRVMNIEAMEREKFAAQNESSRLQYRIDGLERDRQDFMSFYHKQIGIRDREIEFMRCLIKDLKKGDNI